MALIGPEDLAPFADIPPAKAAAMIEDTVARAARVAPCITEDGFSGAGAAKAILRGIILRWHESGSGAVQSQTAGPFSMSVDNRQGSGPRFWPSEIEELQRLCRTDSGTKGAFDIGTGPVSLGGHADICALTFGGTYCSCGAVLTANLYPLYEA